MTTTEQRADPVVGAWLPGHTVPVVDENAVRTAAGILLLAGGTAVAVALATGSTRPLQPFGMAFLLDMLARITVGDRWSPSLSLARLAVRRRRPHWVGAPQKVFAWSLGAAIAGAACLSMSILAAPLAVTLALCGTCLVLLLLEAAFGICVGCMLQRALTSTPPQHCADGSCASAH